MSLFSSSRKLFTVNNGINVLCYFSFGRMNIVFKVKYRFPTASITALVGWSPAAVTCTAFLRRTTTRRNRPTAITTLTSSPSSSSPSVTSRSSSPSWELCALASVKKDRSDSKSELKNDSKSESKSDSK